MAPNTLYFEISCHNDMVNLGPLDLLNNFVKEILASEASKSYLNKEHAKISRLKQKCCYKNHIKKD